MKEEVVKKIVCPYDKSKIVINKKSYYVCEKCGRKYPILNNGIMDFLPDGLRSSVDEQKKNKIEMRSGKWKPGLRYWTPGSFAKIIRIGKGTGRMSDKKPGMLMLDVGCGGSAQGDVNVDIYVPDPLPDNFLLASAELLPFKDNSFDIVRSAYVIEHNLYPTELIREHYRVAKKMVKTYTDNSDWICAIGLRIFNTGYIFHDEHYFKWSKEYFSNLIDRLGFKGKVSLFNSSPSLLIKLIALLGRLPRIGPIFYRDLYVEIHKK